ncbi:GRAS transcription factor [Rhynchospora pubera]|uniref:GRAS transcription factor n=1 Tax=Rhynchospora pubera TaxID=906938 RepID=A0AAV8EI82_9POAL|nr:GRAS transcription factor [Rhynchospora pubera]
MKFVPNIGEFFINLGSDRSNSGRNWQSRTKRNHNYSDLDQFVGRLPKQIVVYTDEPIRNENFDKVLLLKGQKYIEEDSMLRKIMQKEMTDHSRQIQAKLSNNKMKQDKSWRILESVDVRSLLITCSKAISVNNHPLAKELISEIRKYSSPHGDWSQRLAYYFVDGLEARLTGTSNEIYHKLVPQNLTVTEFLKVYHMYRVASPCRGTLVYFANQTILNNISKQTEKVHIINYGIMKGFQWPAFFEHFTTWEGFPPKIRMTIIEVPEPGLCPRRKVELIGRRMEDYAKSFNVPFEYEAIVSEWQNVEVEDLKIANDEVVIVTCLVHSEKLSDEAVHANSPRDIFLNNIRKIKPRIFIHVAFNGPNNSPYFPHRFRAALSLYSSFFEMLDSNLPRGNLERLIIEKHFLMPAAINAIAFEGPNRVERPETYRHWHARKLRAGLVPLPVDPKIKKDVINFVQEHYHKEFVVEDDNGWLLLGWKGRILYGFTTWKASEM